MTFTIRFLMTLFTLTSGIYFTFTLLLPFAYALLLLSTMWYCLAMDAERGVRPSTWTSVIGVTGTVTALILVTLLWSIKGPVSLTLSGHVLYSPASFNLSQAILMLAALTAVIWYISNVTPVIGRDGCDMWLTFLSMVLWGVMIAFANSLISIIFLLELLASLLAIALITTGNDLSPLTGAVLLPNDLTKTQNPLQSILLLFWMSMVASLALFTSLIWLSSVDSLGDELPVSNALLAAQTCCLLALTLKGGLLLFPFWKFQFFKNLAPLFMFLYVVFFFTIFVILIPNIVITHLPLVLTLSKLPLVMILTTSLIFLLPFLLESTSFKVFIGLSSALNILFIFLPLLSL